MTKKDVDYRNKAECLTTIYRARPRFIDELFRTQAFSTMHPGSLTSTSQPARSVRFRNTSAP